MILYRPVGLQELRLIYESGLKAFPPRYIFYLAVGALLLLTTACDSRQTDVPITATPLPTSTQRPTEAPTPSAPPIEIPTNRWKPASYLETIPTIQPPPGLVYKQFCDKPKCGSKFWFTGVGYNGASDKSFDVEFYASRLVLSHDQKLVTYEYTGDIWLLNIQTGRQDNLTNTPDCWEYDAVWSPDDRQIVVVGCMGDSDHNRDDLFMIDVASGKRWNLTNTPDRRETSHPGNMLRWWEDQPGQIFFGSETPEVPVLGPVLPGQCHTEQGDCRVFLTSINIDGTGYRVLDPVSGLVSAPALSLDGKTLAYDGGILYDLETGDSEVILPSEYRLPLEIPVFDGVPGLVNPVWSPDGSQIAWIGHFMDDGWYSGAIGIFVFNLQQKSSMVLYSYEQLYFGLTRPTWNLWPDPDIQWSPDGQWISVKANEWRNDPDHPNSSPLPLLMIYNSRGEIEFRHETLSNPPRWSADSRRLAFEYWDYDLKQSDILLVEAASRKLWRVDIQGNVHLYEWLK